MQQRTPEWHEWRRYKVGASEASAIMNCGFNTILDIWSYKLGLKEPEPENDAMRRGIELEDEARAAFESMTDIDMFPACLTHKEYPWMIASLDGLSADEKQAVEIKCPGDRDHKLAKSGVIPPKYVPQLQHQMAVADLDKIFYCSYRDGECIILVAERDEVYITTLIEKEKEFIKILMKGKQTLEEYHDKIEFLKDDLCRIIENDTPVEFIPDI